MYEDPIPVVKFGETRWSWTFVDCQSFQISSVTLLRYDMDKYSTKFMNGLLFSTRG